MSRHSFIDIVELKYSALWLEVSQVSDLALSSVWNKHLLACGWVDIQFILRFLAFVSLLLYRGLQSFLEGRVDFDATGPSDRTSWLLISLRSFNLFLGWVDSCIVVKRVKDSSIESLEEIASLLADLLGYLRVHRVIQAGFEGEAIELLCLTPMIFGSCWFWLLYVVDSWLDVFVSRFLASLCGVQAVLEVGLACLQGPIECFFGPHSRLQLRLFLSLLLVLLWLHHAPLHYFFILHLWADSWLYELERRSGQYLLGLEIGDFLINCSRRDRPADLVRIADWERQWLFFLSMRDERFLILRKGALPGMGQGRRERVPSSGLGEFFSINLCKIDPHL